MLPLAFRKHELMVTMLSSSWVVCVGAGVAAFCWWLGRLCRGCDRRRRSQSLVLDHDGTCPPRYPSRRLPRL